MPPRVDKSLCTLCGICVDVCPGDILYLDGGLDRLVRYGSECSHCDVCTVECPQGALTIEFPWSMLQHPVSVPRKDATPDA